MDYYDALETQDPAAREARLLEDLPRLIRHAQQHAPAYTRILADIDPTAVSSRQALAELPVTRKSELLQLQQQNRPFGGFAATIVDDLVRVFQSPGPIYEPEAKRVDYWRMARALFAAGFRKGELIHNAYSYHLTPAGSMMESGAQTLGCPVFPAGVGQTELQVAAMVDLKPRGYVGTPSFLKILLDKAAELDVDVSSLSKALVSGEALPPSLREAFKTRGVSVLQCYATADLGLIAYETPALEGMVAEEGIVIEIVRPGTGEPVAEGEVGELVITSLNPDYPLIRFGTGDLSAVMPGSSPCGRTNTRIKGWMGRADQTTKVKGMFVHPSQVAEVLKRHPEVRKGRLEVDSKEHADIMILHCEVEEAGSEDAMKAIAASIREVCKLRGEVRFVAVGSLPNDGKVIDDIRSYQ